MVDIDRLLGNKTIEESILEMFCFVRDMREDTRWNNRYISAIVMKDDIKIKEVLNYLMPYISAERYNGVQLHELINNQFAVTFRLGGTLFVGSIERPFFLRCNRFNRLLVCEEFPKESLEEIVQLDSISNVYRFEVPQ